ncbi:MAG TPA: hypothetical protein VF756_28970 [Thermoanaerobaculia bacterium]
MQKKLTNYSCERWKGDELIQIFESCVPPDSKMEIEWWVDDYLSGSDAKCTWGIAHPMVSQKNKWMRLVEDAGKIDWENLSSSKVGALIFLNTGLSGSLLPGCMLATMNHEYSVHALAYRADFQKSLSMEQEQRKAFWKDYMSLHAWRHHYEFGQDRNKDYQKIHHSLMKRIKKTSLQDQMVWEFALDQESKKDVKNHWQLLPPVSSLFTTVEPPTVKPLVQEPSPVSNSRKLTYLEPNFRPSSPPDQLFLRKLKPYS